MKTIPHPSHARTTRFAIAALLACTAMSFFCGFYFADWTGQNNANLLTAATFMLFGSAALLLAILRAFICRCATCGRWLTKQMKPSDENPERKFVCDKCDVVWDSKIELSIGGD